MSSFWIDFGDPRIEALENAPLGLFCVAASWSVANETNGHVPAGVAYSLGVEDEIDALLRFGVWHSNPGGYWIATGLIALSHPHAAARETKS